MENEERNRLTDAELKAFFDRLFPSGVAGADVRAEIAPEGWAHSALLACFHPSVEQTFQERLQIHRNIEELARIRREREPENPRSEPRPEPTLEEARAEWKETPVEEAEEITELLGMCLWDLFSDNHEVIAADGRIADIGSFRGAGAFLDEHISGSAESWREGDYMRFYLGTIWIQRRADLSPVYQMIFGRLKSLGADWRYYFPELHVVDLAPLRGEEPGLAEYSPSESFAKEQEETERQTELERMRAELTEIQELARREALDRPPPATVRAYQAIYGRDPKGWPPA